MSVSTPPLTVPEPRRLAAWIPLAVLAAALWLASGWMAYDSHRGTPHEVFSGFISAAVVASVVTAIVGVGNTLARNQVALAAKLDAMVAEQRELFVGLGENTGAFQQLSARVAQLTDPERMDWPSYTAGASDALGVDRGNVVGFPTGGRNRG